MSDNGLEGEDRAIPAALDRSAAPSGSSPVPGLEQSPLPHIAAHTPGPWQDIAGTTTGRRVISLAAVAKARTTIAHVGGPDRDANARLIAAAPTMAAAITEYLAARAGYEVAPTHNSRVCDAAAERYALALDGLSAAIAKASGK